MSFELQGSGTYEDVVLQAKALIEDEPELVPNMANLSALLNLILKNINWVGFYTVQPDGNLLLGPFQGKPACIRIKAGRGVCGTALAEKKTLRVADVYAFPGHIACDGKTNSELVIPIHANGAVVAVLDLDSMRPARFTEADVQGLSTFAKILEDNCFWK